MYKNDELSEGEAEDEKLFNDMYKFITENDMSIEENYRKACAMIDMDNLVEYAATEMYIFNDDWYLEQLCLLAHKNHRAGQ